MKGETILLRKWLASNVGKHVKLDWIEHGRYGATEGFPDVVVSCGIMTVYLELKVWEHRPRGFICKMRPVQRGWHLRSMKAGKRTAVLASVEIYGDEQKMLVRGDHIPLRDKTWDVDSGCIDGRFRCARIMFPFDLDKFMFDESVGFWL